jgi:hypothetical protein
MQFQNDLLSPHLPSKMIKTDTQSSNVASLFVVVYITVITRKIIDKKQQSTQPHLVAFYCVLHCDMFLLVSKAIRHIRTKFLQTDVYMQHARFFPTCVRSQSHTIIVP